MGRTGDKTAARGPRLAQAAAVFFLLVPLTAAADSARLGTTLTYSDLHTSSRDASGAEASQENRTFIQLYNLHADKDLLPMLKLSGGGTLQQNDADVIANNRRDDFSSTLTRPFAELRLNNPVLSAGTGFNRVTNVSTFAGVRGPTIVSDTYNAFVGWKPAELPTLDVSLIRTNNYDRSRTTNDMLTNQLNIFTRYEPVRSIELKYQGTSISTDDRIRDLETRILSHNGRVAYSDRLLGDRLSLSSTYDISRSTVETRRGGAGSVDFQTFAFEGLYAASLTPNFVQLPTMPFLIDNDANNPNNNAINIGSSAFTQPTPQGAAPRNIGLRFGAPTEINALFVWVNSGASYLTQAVAASFSWSVYTSTDNQTWTLHDVVASAPYELNAALPGVGKFELTFPNVTTAWIKVVVNPLPATGEGLLFPSIGVTELQAFVRRTASDVRGERAGQNESINVYAKALLLEKLPVYYDFSYFAFSSSAGDVTQRRWTAANGLSASHRFTRALLGATRLERVDEKDPTTGPAVSYNYSASLQATPLPTLRNSLAYGLNLRETRNGRSNTNSFFFGNTAELYTNVNAFLNGGWSTAHLETDQTTRGTTYSYGIGLAPTKKTNITVSVTDQETTQTGGGHTELHLVTRRLDGTASYMPFSTLYLTAAASRVAQGEIRDTEQNYGVNWSPFPGGALQFGFSYSEGRNTRDNSVSRLTQPSVRWVISRWATADASYISSDSRSDLGNSFTRGVSCNFRAIF